MKNFKKYRDKFYLWFLNKFKATSDEYYSFEKPSIEWMKEHNKTFWIQPCSDCIDGLEVK